MAIRRVDLEKQLERRLIQYIIYLLLFSYFSGFFSFDILGDSRNLPVHFTLRSTGPRSASSRSTRTDWIFIDRRRTSMDDDAVADLDDAYGYRCTRWY